jgi:hypothetical protein
MTQTKLTCIAVYTYQFPLHILIHRQLIQLINMTTLNSLPRELRQQILLAAVQDENFVGGTWPKTPISLFQTCHLFRHEMPWVLDSWTPLWTLQKPADVMFLQRSAIDGRPIIHHICINIFHDICVRRLRIADWNFVCRGASLTEPMKA